MRGRKRQEKIKMSAAGAADIGLLNMGVITDMLLAVAVIAIAPGTVPELQIRMGNVGFSANGAAVGIRGLGSGGCCFVGTCIERDNLRLLWTGGIAVPAQHTLEINTPAHGNDIQDILAEEQKVVCKGNDAEQIVGEGQGKQIQQHDYKIEQCKNPGFDRDEEKQQEMCVGIHGGIAEEQAQIQICDISLSAEDHAVNVHQNHAGNIEQIELQCAPDIFHSTSEGIVAQQGNGNQKQITVAGTIGEGIGKQAPDLTMQDAFPVEAENVVKNIVSGHLADQIYNGGSHSDIEHQIGNALITICITETFETCAKIFQIQSLLIIAFPILPVIEEKVYNRFVNDYAKKEGKMVLTF